MKAKETTLEEPVQTEILWEDATLHSLKIFPKYLLHLQRRLNKIIEVKGLKLSWSFYFADYVQFKLSFKQQIFSKVLDYLEFKSCGFESLVQNISVL